MKYDHAGFARNPAARYNSASQAEIEDRIERFLPLVRRTAWHIYGTGRPDLDIDDLIQAGIVVLAECAQKHSGPGEDGFAAYAKIRVRGAMLDLIRKLMNDTRTARKKRREYEAECDRLRSELGRDPSRKEIAEGLHIDDTQLREIEASGVTVLSINEEYDESSTAFASDDPDPFEMLSDMEDRERLVQALEELPDRLKLVLQLFYVEELNLTEISEVLEVSVPRVHQLRAKALQDLRALMEGAG